MATKKIVIQHENKRKEFNLTLKRYNELKSLIDYYSYDLCLQDYIFVYSNSLIFNIIDLYLSSFSTPQPARDSYY